MKRGSWGEPLGLYVLFLHVCRLYPDPGIVDPLDYSHAQSLGRQLHAAGSQGILYPSVRRPGGTCLAALRTGIVRDCLHAAYLEYHWNGQAVDAVYEMSQLV